MPELNGAPPTAEDLKLLALTNYGHYTSMRADDQHVRGFSQHLDRLVRDCRLVFDTDLDREKVRGFIQHAMRGKAGSFSIRVTIFDPTLEMGRPSINAQPHVLVTTRSATPLPAPPLRVQSVKYRRDLPPVKHIGLFGAMWHRRSAQLNGFDDVLFVDDGSFVSEGATWNIGFFDGNRIIWPDAEVLPGITMRLLQQVHDQTVTAPVCLAEIPDMQTAFATNTTVGVRPITFIDDLSLPGDHPIFETLRREYLEIPAEPL